MRVLRGTPSSISMRHLFGLVAVACGEETLEPGFTDSLWVHHSLDGGGGGPLSQSKGHLTHNHNLLFTLYVGYDYSLVFSTIKKKFVYKKS